MVKTATKTAKKKSIYGVHPGVLMTQKWIAELKQKTGRTLDEWLKLIKKEGPPTEKERRDWLKTNNAKNDRITHRFEITSLKDIDDEVNRWLRVAYERDA
jgi:hypothetical protein